MDIAAKAWPDCRMVDSFSRPGGNATGMYALVNTLVAKQLEVLREVVPGATTVAFIDNPTNPFSELRLREILEAACARAKAQAHSSQTTHTRRPSRGGRLWQRRTVTLAPAPTGTLTNLGSQDAVRIAWWGFT